MKSLYEGLLSKSNKTNTSATKLDAIIGELNWWMDYERSCGRRGNFESWNESEVILSGNTLTLKRELIYNGNHVDRIDFINFLKSLKINKLILMAGYSRTHRIWVKEISDFEIDCESSLQLENIMDGVFKNLHIRMLTNGGSSKLRFIMDKSTHINCTYENANLSLNGENGIVWKNSKVTNPWATPTIHFTSTSPYQKIFMKFIRDTKKGKPASLAGILNDIDLNQIFEFEYFKSTTNPSNIHIYIAPTKKELDYADSWYMHDIETDGVFTAWYQEKGQHSTKDPFD